MRFIYNNLAVIHVALVASLTAWLFGGTQSGPLAQVLPWLFLFTVEVLYVFPQKRFGESTFSARERVWGEMKRDPLVWVSVVLLLILAVPFLNNGLCVNCDRVLIARGIPAEPKIPFLPFCVNRAEHYGVFLWFLTGLSCAIAVKHCLNHPGKRLLVKMIVWNGFALALLGFVQAVAGAPGPLWQPLVSPVEGWAIAPFFSTFGYANMAGDYFVTMFALSVALWRRADDDFIEEQKTYRSEIVQNRYRTFCRRYYFLIPAVFFFFAAINTLSRAAIISVLALTVIYFIHTFFLISHRLHRAERLRKGVVALAMVFAVAFFAVETMPDDVRREVDTINTSEVLTRVTGKSDNSPRAALKIWRQHALFGCGGWGFKHFFVQVARPRQKNTPMLGGINVHNDYLQFLAEHGLVGFGLMSVVVLLLMLPVFRTWGRLIQTTRFMKPRDRPARPMALFVLPAPVFCLLMGALATLVHAFGDCPFRSAAIFVQFFITLAVMPGFLPEDGESSQEV